MKSEDFEEACQHSILGWIWDETFNKDYTESVSLSIQEMRNIINTLRIHEGKFTMKHPTAFSEEKEAEYKKL